MSEQDGGTEQSSKVTLSLAEQRRRERAAWMKKWGPLRKFDKEIQKAIKEHHCEKYCGLIVCNREDFQQCEEHHDKLYREYLEAAGYPKAADLIISQFRATEYL